MMKRIFTFGFIFFIFAACRSGALDETANRSQISLQERMQKVYIESIQVMPKAASGDEYEIIVRGNLPNPAYRIERYDVKVDGRQINVIPRVKYNKGVMVVQMLVPFEDTVKVKLKKIGDYKIHIEGRGKSIIKDLKIR